MAVSGCRIRGIFGRDYGPEVVPATWHSPRHNEAADEGDERIRRRHQQACEGDWPKADADEGRGVQERGSAKTSLRTTLPSPTDAIQGLWTFVRSPPAGRSASSANQHGSVVFPPSQLDDAGIDLTLDPVVGRALDVEDGGCDVTAGPDVTPWPKPACGKQDRHGSKKRCDAEGITQATCQGRRG